MTSDRASRIFTFAAMGTPAVLFIECRAAAGGRWGLVVIVSLPAEGYDDARSEVNALLAMPDGVEFAGRSKHLPYVDCVRWS